MRISVLFVMLGLSLGATPLQAEVFRCTGQHGEPEFSQLPCDQGRSVVPPAQLPRDPSATGLRASEHDWLVARERQRRRSVKRREAPRAPLTKPDPKVGAYRCSRRRQALDAVNAKLRRGYKAGQGDRLRRRRQAHEDYLATFCS